VAEELQSIIDTAKAPKIWVQIVNEWNNKAFEITSFTRQEVVGRDLVQEFFTE